jgi:hypothetical protein
MGHPQQTIGDTRAFVSQVYGFLPRAAEMCRPHSALLRYFGPNNSPIAPKSSSAATSVFAMTGE